MALNYVKIGSVALESFFFKGCRQSLSFAIESLQKVDYFKKNSLKRSGGTRMSFKLCITCVEPIELPDDHEM